MQWFFWSHIGLYTPSRSVSTEFLVSVASVNKLAEQLDWIGEQHDRMRDVFLHNKEATLDILGRFTEELFVLQRAIRMGDGQQLFDYFSRTRAIRRGIIEAGQDTGAPDFGRGHDDAPRGS